MRFGKATAGNTRGFVQKGGGGNLRTKSSCRRKLQDRNLVKHVGTLIIAKTQGMETGVTECFRGGRAHSAKELGGGTTKKFFLKGHWRGRKATATQKQNAGPPNPRGSPLFGETLGGEQGGEYSSLLKPRIVTANRLKQKGRNY